MEGRGSFWIFAGAGLLTVVAMAAFEAPSFVSRHIEGSHANPNAPPPVVFQKYLTRDLLAYFDKSPVAATKVQYSLIRSRPAQSEPADPNYYAWVQVYSGDSVVEEGAVRIAAVDRSRFEIRDFFERSSIVRNPALLASVFPEPVMNGILTRARADR